MAVLFRYAQFSLVHAGPARNFRSPAGAAAYNYYDKIPVLKCRVPVLTSYRAYLRVGYR